MIRTAPDDAGDLFIGLITAETGTDDPLRAYLLRRRLIGSDETVAAIHFRSDTGPPRPVVRPTVRVVVAAPDAGPDGARGPSPAQRRRFVDLDPSELSYQFFFRLFRSFDLVLERRTAASAPDPAAARDA